MITLTTEQAQQIEEVLFGCRPTVISHENWNDIYKARAIITAARAQAGHIADADKMVLEQVLNYERLNALRDGEQNKAEDDYFNARPENDTPTLRKMFCQGFERGFHKGIKYSASVEHVKQEPVAIMSPNKANIVGINTPYANIGTDDWIKLCAAPVRTKDLTDDEISYIWRKYRDHITSTLGFARAVIAADREKSR